MHFFLLKKRCAAKLNVSGCGAEPQPYDRPRATLPAVFQGVTELRFGSNSGSAPGVTFCVMERRNANARSCPNSDVRLEARSDNRLLDVGPIALGTLASDFGHFRPRRRPIRAVRAGPDVRRDVRGPDRVELVVNGRRRTCDVVDRIGFHVERKCDVVSHELESCDGRAGLRCWFWPL